MKLFVRVTARASRRCGGIGHNPLTCGRCCGAACRSGRSFSTATKPAEAVKEAIGMQGIAPKTKAPVVAKLPSKECLMAIAKNYPGALSQGALVTSMRTMMDKKGFTEEGTLLATSTCPDEINRPVDSILGSLGDFMPLGGLSGLPFAGKTGFKAYASHVPDDGQIMVFFGPHIGISSAGEIGKVQREGMKNVSASCGACIGGYHAIKDSPPAQPEKKSMLQRLFGSAEAAKGEPIGDRQMETILDMFKTAVPVVDQEEAHPYVALSYWMQKKIKSEVLGIVAPDQPFPIALVGGVMINTCNGRQQSEFFHLQDFLLRPKMGNLFQDISKEMVDEVEASLLKVEGEDGGYLYVTPEELQM